nr:MAG TPA: hypothetical protein [Caudoviricetes sp.]
MLPAFLFPPSTTFSPMVPNVRHLPSPALSAAHCTFL